jgi:iron complex outermembrane recepter protein
MHQFAIFTVSAIALSVGLASTAHAQSDPSATQITVTGLRPVADSAAGTKTDTPLIDIPQSISVISAAQIDAQGAQTLGEALRYASGVNAEQYGGLDQRIDYYMIRGFANSMPYTDGLNTNSRYTLLAPKVDPYGLQQIEVLRGPASVLYGQNVPGGLIATVCKR